MRLYDVLCRSWHVHINCHLAHVRHGSSMRVCRDFRGGFVSLESSLKQSMHSCVDNHLRLRIYLASSQSCFPDDVRKVAQVHERVSRYSEAVAQQCDSDLHAQVLSWQPGRSV